MSSEDTVINVERLSKRYRIGLKDEMHENFASAAFDFIKSPLKNFRKYRSLYRFDDVKLDDLSDPGKNSEDVIWALRDVSFKVKQGEVIGIIGSNGAGKSTLLKILSKITFPTLGSAKITGRISSLLEVGTGFHLELTGRENVYLNGTVLGMRKKEIDNKFDEIVEFSGVKKFIDTPVKRYSSGMKVRLAFSVAAHLEPEILMVDEVLAVGDTSFQSKCLGKMSEVSSQGRTVLFVSHNLAAIEGLCDRVLLLESGKIKADTTPSEAILIYLRSLNKNAETGNFASFKREPPLLPIIQKIEFINQHGQFVSSIPANSGLTIHIHYKHVEPIKDPYFGLTFETSLGLNVFFVQTRMQNGAFPDLPPSGVIVCNIPSIPLLPGTYFVSPGCGSQSTQLDYIVRGCKLSVTETDVYGTGRLPHPKKAVVLVDADWKVL